MAISENLLKYFNRKVSKSLNENHTRFGNDERNDIYLTKTFNHNSCLSGRKSMAVHELIII